VCCWFVRVFVCSFVRLFVCRVADLLVCLLVGLLVGWFVGLLVVVVVCLFVGSRPVLHCRFMQDTRAKVHLSCRGCVVTYCSTFLIKSTLLLLTHSLPMTDLGLGTCCATGWHVGLRRLARPCVLLGHHHWNNVAKLPGAHSGCVCIGYLQRRSQGVRFWCRQSRSYVPCYWSN
jgi:hypothetical protein